MTTAYAIADDSLFCEAHVPWTSSSRALARLSAKSSWRAPPGATLGEIQVGGMPPGATLGEIKLAGRRRARLSAKSKLAGAAARSPRCGCRGLAAGCARPLAASDGWWHAHVSGGSAIHRCARSGSALRRARARGAMARGVARGAVVEQPCRAGPRARHIDGNRMRVCASSSCFPWSSCPWRRAGATIRALSWAPSRTGPT